MTFGWLSQPMETATGLVSLPLKEDVQFKGHE